MCSRHICSSSAIRRRSGFFHKYSRQHYSEGSIDGPLTPNGSNDICSVGLKHVQPEQESGCLLGFPTTQAGFMSKGFMVFFAMSRTLRNPYRICGFLFRKNRLGDSEKMIGCRRICGFLFRTKRLGDSGKIIGCRRVLQVTIAGRGVAIADRRVLQFRKNTTCPGTRHTNATMYVRDRHVSKSSLPYDMKAHDNWRTQRTP